MITVSSLTKHYGDRVAEDDMSFDVAAGGQVVPEIQRTVGVEGVADALAEIGSGHVSSKIVVDPTDSQHHRIR